jgi:deazaflavin-dependent oxidoreductase (nitroreductase family)
VLLLGTTGRRSGRERTTPVQCAEAGDQLVIVASNGGEPLARARRGGARRRLPVVVLHQ